MKRTVNKVAVALGQAVQSMDRSTGTSHSFVVALSRADGSDSQRQRVAVIAISWADAWGLIGDAIQKFIDGPEGRVVHSITAER